MNNQVKYELLLNTKKVIVIPLKCYTFKNFVKLDGPTTMKKIKKLYHTLEESLAIFSEQNGDKIVCVKEKIYKLDFVLFLYILYLVLKKFHVYFWNAK